MRSLSLISAAILVAGLSACTTRDPEALAQHDPFEPTNRFFFDVSMKADKAVLKPVARGYNDVVPEPVRDGIHNMLTNINEPVVAGDEFLGGSGKDAFNTVGRFVVNSTAGVGGMIDIATKIGMPQDEDTDGGVVFGKWGVKEGPYIFAPLVGPTPPRDILGRGLDLYLDPLQYADFPGDMTLRYSRLGLGVLDERARTIDQLEGIERTSVDFYATTRSLYRQHRAAQINGGTGSTTAPQNLPNF